MTVDLDDAKAVRDQDPGGMVAAVGNLGSDCREGGTTPRLTGARSRPLAAYGCRVEPRRLPAERRQLPRDVRDDSVAS